MAQFFAKDWTGAPFVMFGPPHVIALILILAFNVSLVQLRRVGPSGRKIFRCTLATILIVNETAWHVWNAATGQWTLQTLLPLHLCSVLVWVSAFMLYTANFRLYEYIYFFGIGAATQALLTPDAGIYGFPHFRFFQTLISHGSIVAGAVYMTVVEGYRPQWISLVRVAVTGNIYMAFVGLVNWLLGSNYMFIARKPDTPSLIDVLGPWPWYILSLEAIGALVFLILYLPFALGDWRAKTVSAA